MALTFWRAATTGSLTDDRSTALVSKVGGSPDALAKAIASENLIAACGVAECLVKIKAIESSAAVEMKRLEEYGATERCRISEEHKSGRFNRQAKVSELAVSESAKTKRLDIGAWQTVASEAVAANARIEEARAKVTPLFAWLFGGEDGSLLGPTITGAVIGAVFVGNPARRREATRTWAALARKVAFVVVMIALPVWLIRRRLRHMGEELAASKDAWLGPVMSVLWRVAGCANSLGIEGFWGSAKMPLADGKERGNAGDKAAAISAKAPRADGERSASSRPAAVPEIAPELSEVRATPADIIKELGECLAAWGLENYEVELQNRGYDKPLLWSLNAAERGAMFEAIGCKPGHRVKFQRMLDGQSPPAPGGSPSHSFSGQ